LLRAFDAIAEEWIKRMGAGVEGAIGTYESSDSYGNDASIDPCSVEVDKNTFTNPGKNEQLLDTKNVLGSYWRLVP